MLDNTVGSPSEVRPAASVILLRSGEMGIEVFIQHRAATMDFAAGMVVFPGGRVDQKDRRAGETGVHSTEVIARHAAAWHASDLKAWSGGDVQVAAATLLSTVQRELLEETGLLLPAESFRPWANWITPPGRPKRFDTYFYIARAGVGDVPRHQTTEATSSEWQSIEGVLAAAVAGTMQLMRPTQTILRALTEERNIEELFTCNRKISPVRPDP